MTVRYGELRSNAQRKDMTDLEAHLNEAEQKAWDSLSRYKFQMFGYWAAIWVHLNRIGGFRRNNPFTDIVKLAKWRIKGSK